MLHEFITGHRAEILERAHARVSSRSGLLATNPELERGIPLFVDELVEMLRDSLRDNTHLGADASRHGSRGFEVGLTVGQVVHEYGDICQVVTSLAEEMRFRVATAEFRALNRFLDEAIAGAVTGHAEASQGALSVHNMERLGELAHEMRNSLSSAVLAYEVLKSGTVPIGGSTGAVLGRSLAALKTVLERSLTEVRLDAGLRDTHAIDVQRLLAETGLAAKITALDTGIFLSVESVEHGVTVQGDRHLLSSAITNLVQNALKFTRSGGHVTLRSKATASNVRIEVEDECGGLGEDVHHGLFRAFTPGNRIKSGLGLGLSISQRAIESMGGTLRATDKPQCGCIFTIELPRLHVLSTAHVPEQTPVVTKRHRSQPLAHSDARRERENRFASSSGNQPPAHGNSGA